MRGYVGAFAALRPFVAVHALAAFVAFLRFQAERGDGARTLVRLPSPIGSPVSSQ